MAIYKSMLMNEENRYCVGRREHFVKEGESILQKIEKMLGEEAETEENIGIDWWTFYHFSELRQGILSWYPFQRGKNILEIGAECGALTGFLCDKANWVTAIESDSRKSDILYQRYEEKNNLEVISWAYEELENLTLDKKYDYIIINRVFEYLKDMTSFKSGNFLKQIITNFLHKKGKIILIADNRYGIRNFCGGRDVLTGKPFDGINKYPTGGNGMTYSRDELKEAIEAAGIGYYKFYYPLPDYKITQLVYSDNYAAIDDIRNRIVFYEPCQETLMALENNMYEDIVKNRALPFLSNSFFVECCLENQITDIDFVTCSQDRGEEYSMITAISANGTVVKSAVYDAGKDSLLKSVNNLKELETRGIKTVPSEIVDNSIVMPLIKEKTLSSYLVEAAEKDKEGFWKALVLWYQDILKSSNYDTKQCKEIFRELLESERGVVLEKAYYDMIPMNCFVGDKEHIYFDQEFTDNFVPAKYVFFRGIKYLYQSHKSIEKEIPLEEVKRQFGLAECWKVFERAEAQFISDVRKVQKHKEFYQWTKYNRKEIYNRVDILEYQGESVTEYKVTESTKIQQKVQLDLLDKFTKVCKDNNLRFFMMYGSLLGTVRHKGFIPWDDDVDVAMPRKDYDKLLEIADDAFLYPYFLQSPEKDMDVFYGGYSKLRNSATTGMEPRNWKHNSNQGIWIDIFPLDVCYEEEAKNYESWINIHKCQQMLFTSIYDKKFGDLDMDLEEWEELKRESLLHPKDYWYKRLDDLLRECREKESPYLAIKTRYKSVPPKLFFAEDFSDVVMMDFEGLKMPVPIGYKRCLEIVNGRRYMMYAKPENRLPHHKGLFSADTPYTKYIERFDLDKNLGHVILLGESDVIQFYVNKNKKKLKEIVLLNDFIEYKDNALEFPKIHRAELKAYETYTIIICAKKFVDYEKMLCKHDIHDYKIYITNPQHIIQRN